MAYINDIILYSPSLEQHSRELKEVFFWLENASLLLRVRKTKWVKESIMVLGHRVFAAGIELNPHKVVDVRRIQPLINITELKRFMVITGFYWRFISGCSTVREPIFRL